MKIYDKAKWQIENGMSIATVSEHFLLVFSWLKDKNMLNSEGLETMNIGIDSSTVLTDNMVTDQGEKFLDKYYDELIKSSCYNTNSEIEKLNSFFNEFIEQST